VLNFIYYPISFIMWCWHKVFGSVLGEANGFAWALSVIFLVFTIRLLLFKPFVTQVRSMRKMQEVGPEMQRLKKKYSNDRQKFALEMQKLQSKEGFNPLGGCLPIIVQIPVFLGLFQVLKGFLPGRPYNYFFDAQGVESFVRSHLFGAKLSASLVPLRGAPGLEVYNTSLSQMLVVMVPLMIMAGVFTHITARHSVARQTAVQADNPQTAIMNKMMLYLFPAGVVLAAPYLPLAVLLYWVANNLWTLAQQYVVYRRIDEEEATKKAKTLEEQQARAPKPGQKPVRDRGPERSASSSADEQGPGGRVEDESVSEPATKHPGAKPVSQKAAVQDADDSSGANGSPNGSSTSGGGRSRTPAGSARQAARRGGGRKRR